MIRDLKHTKHRINKLLQYGLPGSVNQTTINPPLGKAWSRPVSPFVDTTQVPMTASLMPFSNHKQAKPI